MLCDLVLWKRLRILSRRIPPPGIFYNRGFLEKQSLILEDFLYKLSSTITDYGDLETLEARLHEATAMILQSNDFSVRSVFTSFLEDRAWSPPISDLRYIAHPICYGDDAGQSYFIHMTLVRHFYVWIFCESLFGFQLSAFGLRLSAFGWVFAPDKKEKQWSVSSVVYIRSWFPRG